MNLIRLHDGTHRMVEFSDIGEGLSGMYDPDDPEDVALLRFDIYEKVDGEWETMDDGSYCTRMPVDTPPGIIMKALQFIMDETFDLDRVKKAGEALSWMEPSWFSEEVS